MAKSFQYDPNKEKKNKYKHGIDFTAAQQVFEDKNKITKKVADKKGHFGEDRFKTTGNVFQKIWNVIWTPRDEDIRIISAHRAGKKDVRKYGRNKS